MIIHDGRDSCKRYCPTADLHSEVVTKVQGGSVRCLDCCLDCLLIVHQWQPANEHSLVHKATSASTYGGCHVLWSSVVANAKVWSRAQHRMTNVRR